MPRLAESVMTSHRLLFIAAPLMALLCLGGCETGPQEPRARKAEGAAKDIKPKEGPPVVKPDSVLEGDAPRRDAASELQPAPIVTRKQPPADTSPSLERKRPRRVIE